MVVLVLAEKQDHEPDKAQYELMCYQSFLRIRVSI